MGGDYAARASVAQNCRDTRPRTHQRDRAKVFDWHGVGVGLSSLGKWEVTKLSGYKRATRVRPVIVLPSTVVTPRPAKSESHHLRLPNALWERVREAADTDRRTCANMVQVLLEEALAGRDQ